MRLPLLLPLSLLWLTGCGGPPRDSQRPASSRISASPEDPGEGTPDAPQTQARVTAEFHLRGLPEARRGELDVTLTLPLHWVKQPFTALKLRFREEEFRKGRSGYARFVDRIHDDGAYRPWTDEFARPDGKVLTANYRIRLDHHLFDPVVGLDEVPHPTASGWFLNGRAMLPSIRIVLGDGAEKELDLNAVMTLTFPDGWASISSVGEGAGPEWRADALSSLRNALYYAGTFARTEVRSGRSRVEVVSQDFSAAELKPLEELVSRTLAQGTTVLGELPEERLLLIYDRGTERAGGVVGRGVSLLYDRAPDARASSPMGTVVVHELVHLWNRADAWWLNEGLTRYFEVVLSLRIDGASPAEAGRRLANLASRYLATSSGASVAEARGGEAYAAGALFAFCVDVELRKHGSSLPAVHRRVRQAAGPGNALGADVFLRAIGETSAETLKVARRLFALPGPVDVVPCMKQAGYRVRSTTVSSFTAEALALSVLGITSHDLETATVLRALPASALKPGDVITQVGKRRVSSMDDVSEALATARTGTTVPLVVTRGQEEVTVRLVVPELPAQSRRRHVRIDVTGHPASSPLLD